MWFFRLSLAFQMAIAIMFGIFVGLFLGDICGAFAPLGASYIMILKITTIPYLICAVIHGVGKLAASSAKTILLKGAIFIAGTWAINMLMIYLAVLLFPKSAGIPFATYSATQPTTPNFAELLIPENIFYSLSNNIVPAIVIFGLILGIALMHLKEKQTFMSILETMVDALTRITSWISRITPIGTFLIIAQQVGTMQLTTVKQVSTYLILYIFAILIIVFWIFPRLTSMLTQIPAGRWIKDLSPILILAYTTTVVIVTLPFIIELVKRETESFYHKDGRIKDQIQGIVTVTFNMPLGSLFLSIFVFFVAAFYHFPLSLASQIQLFLTNFLTSLGAVGIGSWINSLNFILDSLGLPLDAIDLYLITVPFTAGFQSMVSVMEISCLALFIALACHNLISFRWHKIIKSAVVTAAPIFLLVLGLKAFNPFPAIYNPTRSICDVNVSSNIKVTLYTDQNLPDGRSGDVFERVMSSKTLRVGYNTHSTPFCFYNSYQHVVGYDIAFAYALAHDLGCNLELIPMTYGSVAEELELGLYDIGMSGISVTENRLKSICFSQSYLESRIVFVMKKKLSKKLTSAEAILEDDDVPVVVLKGTAYESLAFSLFPKSRIVSVEDYADFPKQYSNGVLIRGEPQAISWSLRYPHYTIVAPDPPIGMDTLAYAVKPDEDRFLCFLNQWLMLKRQNGLTQDQYDLWVLGKTENIIPQKRRWSIIQDVLHWTD